LAQLAEKRVRETEIPRTYASRLTKLGAANGLGFESARVEIEQYPPELIAVACGNVQPGCDACPPTRLSFLLAGAPALAGLFARPLGDMAKNITTAWKTEGDSQ